jgi:hypothetical protein
MFAYSIPSLRFLDRALGHLVRAVCVLTGLVLTSVPAAAQSSSAATQPAKRPSFHLVAQATAQYFATLQDYKTGDLISQSQVAAALAHIAGATGWDVPDGKALIERALADNSFLVAQFSTASGRPFMRKIARYPGSYSRLDRLSSISGGQQSIKDIMSKKGGSDMIEYMATTRGGRELGAMMAGAQQGVDLNKPTGRIYTADDLLNELKRVYAKTKP